MRIGVVGDIHGNLSGLERALLAMGPVDQLLFHRRWLSGAGQGET